MPITPGQLPESRLPLSNSSEPKQIHGVYKEIERCSTHKFFWDSLKLQASTLNPRMHHKLQMSVKSAQAKLKEHACDMNYVSEKWCSNHMRWILWKLNSHDALKDGGHLSTEAVADELKYRCVSIIIFTLTCVC